MIRHADADPDLIIKLLFQTKIPFVFHQLQLHVYNHIQHDCASEYAPDCLQVGTECTSRKLHLRELE